MMRRLVTKLLTWMLPRKTVTGGWSTWGVRPWPLRASSRRYGTPTWDTSSEQVYHWGTEGRGFRGVSYGPGKPALVDLAGRIS